MSKEQKITKIHNTLSEMLINLERHSKSGAALHEVELNLFSQLLSLGNQLLSYYIMLVGELLLCEASLDEASSSVLRNKGKSSRLYRSVFGLLAISRIRYCHPNGEMSYPLDKRLNLPQNRYSYVLQDWMGYGAVEMDFDQSVSFLNRILGQNLKAMQSSRQTYGLSQEVEPYYEGYNWEPDKEISHFSVGFDGKGVPIRRSETDRASESVATRLGKGAKKGVKKEATVSVSSSFIARKRDPEEILSALFEAAPETKPSKKSPKKKTHSWHLNKHLRAFLSDKKRAINYGIEQVLARGASSSKPIVVLIDGDRALEKAVKEIVEEKQIEGMVDAYVLDFIHLLEYVWKVANAHLGEKHPDREKWVKQQARLLLNSQSKQVLEQWKKILEQPKLRPTPKKNVEAAISYLQNRPHMIDYKTFLQKGFPITTGAVESACGHFVKSRMERNAMHWGKKGAQDMLNLRAVKKNGHWDGYINHLINEQQKQIYREAA